MKYLKYIFLFIVVFIASTEYAPRASASVLDTVGQGTLYDVTLTSDAPRSHIGTGYTGTVSKIKMINNQSASTTVNLIACATSGVAVSIVKDCYTTDNSGNRQSILTFPASQDYSIQSLGGGMYLHTWATTTPYYSMNPAWYYHMQTAGVDTMGMTTKYFAQDCVTATGNACGSMLTMYTYLETSGYIPPAFEYPTRIVSVTPYDGQTISSTTIATLSVHVLLNSGDAGSQISFQVTPLNSYVGGGSLFGWLGGDFTDYGEFSFIATTTGDIYYSIPAPLLYAPGSYGIDVSLRSCFSVIVTDICDTALRDSDGLLIATSTNFAVDADSAIGAEFNNQTEILDSIFSGTATTTSFSESCATFATLDVTKCMVSLFVPNWSGIQQIGDEIHDEILTIFPFGYVTRTVDIFRGTGGGVQPPPLTYSFGSSSPAVLQYATNGDPISFQLFDPAYWDSNSPLQSIRADTGGNENVWDVINPFVTWLTVIGVFFVIIEDLIGFSMPTRTGAGYPHPEISRKFKDKDIMRAMQKGGTLSEVEERAIMEKMGNTPRIL